MIINLKKCFYSHGTSVCSTEAGSAISKTNYIHKTEYSTAERCNNETKERTAEEANRKDKPIKRVKDFIKIFRWRRGAFFHKNNNYSFVSEKIESLSFSISIISCSSVFIVSKETEVKRRSH